MVEIWSDVNNKLKRDRFGDVRKEVNLDCIACAIENILLTRKGERVMRPGFGSLLEKYLFEPLNESTAHLIALEILDALKKQEDRVDVKKVEVVVDERIGGYRITIEAVVRELGVPLVWNRVIIV